MFRRLSIGVGPAIVILFVVAPSVVLGQTVVLDSNGLHADGKAINLRCALGYEGSEHAELTIVNRLGRDIRYRAHLHDPGETFVRFHREDGLAGDLDGPPSGVLNTTDDTRDIFPVYALKREGRPGTFQDAVGVEAWDAASGRRLGYAEVPVVATFFERGVKAARPAGFEMWEIVPGRLVRLRLTDLPLRVYSNHADLSDATPQEAESLARIAARALTVWNQAAGGAKLPPLFALVTDSRQADITIDWSGDGLGGDVLGQARLVRGSPVVADGAVMQRPSGNRPDAMIAEDLLQELGHLLGLGHSQDGNDMMGQHQHAPDENRNHEPLEFVQVTQRDLSALAWLYTQDEFVPIVPRRRLR